MPWTACTCPARALPHAEVCSATPAAGPRPVRSIQTSFVPSSSPCRAREAACSLACHAEAGFPAQEHPCKRNTAASRTRSSLPSEREQPQSHTSVRRHASGRCSAALPAREPPLPRITGRPLETGRSHAGAHRLPWAFGQPPAPSWRRCRRLRAALAQRRWER